MKNEDLKEIRDNQNEKLLKLKIHQSFFDFLESLSEFEIIVEAPKSVKRGVSEKQRKNRV